MTAAESAPIELTPEQISCLEACALPLCECGCGQPVLLARRTNSRTGAIKGQPLRFILGHSGGHDHAPRLERFWSRVNKAGPFPEPKPYRITGRCWLWTGATNDAGYGQLRTNNAIEYAHRMSWEIHHGQITDGLFVCHRCDTPACVNPEHLFLGTHTQNVRDMLAKGRHVSGFVVHRERFTVPRVAPAKAVGA
jgi:hypothetical protein